MKSILVLCTGNSCRSQIAHGYLTYFSKGQLHVESAGITTHGVNPKAIEVMKEDGIDISHHTSDQVDQFLDQSFDVVLTVCDNAQENCPYFPNTTHRIHHNFTDPGKAIGSDKEIMEVFRNVRNEIRAYSEDLVKSILSN